jgi:hypothetical protein
MSSCALDAARNGDKIVLTVETIVMKIDKMISDNYSMLSLYVVFIIAMGFIIWYFGSTLVRRIRTYYQNKGKVEDSTPSISNNVHNKEADNNDYDGNDPAPDDVKVYMDSGKKKFVADLDRVYGEYNDAMGDFIRSTGKTDEDGNVDANVLFRTHDEYKYV